MRKVVLSLLVVGVLLVVGSMLWVGYEVYRSGFSAIPEPTELEVDLVRRARRLAIPSDIRRWLNPVPLSPTVLKEGLEHFADHCAGCHANDGSGDTQIGKHVYPRVPDLRRKETQAMSDGELFFIIHSGIRFTAMPAWGNGNMAQDRGSWKLVHVIRHLPQLTHEELDHMKSLNPQVPDLGAGGVHRH
jgi:hypothetical protein